MCQYIDILRTDEEIDENRDEIGEIREEILSLQRGEIIIGMNVKKLKLMNSDMSPNLLKM